MIFSLAMRRHLHRRLLLGLWIPALACSACGGAGGPSEANAIPPIMVTGCALQMNDNLSPDLRSLAVMVVSLRSARYEIHQVDPTGFRVFTAFREQGGITWALEAQIYSDGSALLQLPDTMPMQSARALRSIEGWSRRVAATFERHRCMPEQQLRTRSAAAGFPF